jgi:hypothetical protein
MRKIISLLQKYSTGRRVAILFVFTMGVYIIMLFYSIPSTIALAPHMKIFDMSPTGYSAEYAFSLLNAIGSEGRNTYLTVQLPIDFIYPGLFGISYSLLLGWLFSKSFNYSSKIFYFSFMPMIAGIFDYFENIGIIVMLNSFPSISTRVVEITNIFTISKSCFTIVFYILLVIGVIPIVKRRVQMLRS